MNVANLAFFVINVHKKAFIEVRFFFIYLHCLSL